MADLEKTIKGLRCHSEPKFGPDEYFCETCPYDEATCGLDVPNDALSLLKAYHQKKRECEQCASKTSAVIESLQEKLRENRINLKELMDKSLNDLIETNRLKPPKILTINDMQATEKGQFLWIELMGGELYCMEAVQVCKGGGKVTEISLNAPRFIYGLTMENYNTGWRVWDSQPTPAMMEAMPWMN